MDRNEEHLAQVFDLRDTETKRFIRSLRDNVFMCIVLRENGDVTIYDKGVGPEEAEQIREAVEETISERMGDASSS